MYYLIGADGKVNGPLSAADVHQWLAEGRASRYSRVRREGDETWQPLASVPELVPPDPGPPAAAPEAPAPAGARAMAEEILARRTTIDAGRCVARAWALVQRDPVILIGSALVAWGLIVGIALLPRVGWIVGMVINSPVLGGLYYVYLGRIRGLAVQPEDVFAGFRRAFTPLVMAGLLVGAITSLGFLALIVPGIYFAIAFMFVQPLVIDKQLDPWAALDISRRVVHQQWWTMLALALIATLIVLAGLLAFGVGVVIAVPVATAALMYAYEDLFGDQGPRR
jgi:hypothetical protein